jgi:CHAT domain-containing protein/tetratricopeptide (TPR) repeat protein
MDALRPCPDAALLAAFLDGALPPDEREAVVSHLVECPQCRAVALTVVEFKEVEALDALWTRETPAPAEPLVTDGISRWSREKTRAPAVAAAIGALIAVGVAFYLGAQWQRPLSSSPSDAVSILIDAAEAQRPVEARLSGATDYALPPSITRKPSGSDAARFQLLNTASNIRNAYENDDAISSRRAMGVAALLTGDLDDAIATLEIGAAGAPQDLTIANDLAAAYYERALRANRHDDLPAALSAVERVLAQQPSSLEALFNRGLIITALGLRREARDAWQAYLDRDPNSPWTAEARERAASLIPTSPPPDWSTLRESIEASAATSDVEVAVRHRATALRDYYERDLLGRWRAAVKAGDEAETARATERMRVIATAFESISGERLYVDLLRSMNNARRRRQLSSYVLALDEYLSAASAMAAGDYAAAATRWRRSGDALRALDSPLAARAEIELAATHLYRQRPDQALRIAKAAGVTARDRRYAILVIRSWWVQGLAGYALNDFATAQVGYEEMLAAATASADIDQWVMANVLLGNLHHTVGNTQQAWRHRVDAAGRLDDVHSRHTRSLFLISAAGDASVGGYYNAALLFQSLLISLSADMAPSLEVQARAQFARSLFELRREGEARAEIARARERLRSVTAETSRLAVEADVLATEVEILRLRDQEGALTAAERLLTLPIVKMDHGRRARAYLQLVELVLERGNLARAKELAEAGFQALDAARATPSAEFSIRASDPVWRLYSVAAQVALAERDLPRAFGYLERGRLKTPQERRAWAASVPTLDQVQRSLTDDTAVAMLAQTGPNLQVWIIRNRSIATHTLPITTSRGATLVSTHLEEMLRGAPVPSASASLFDAVFRPVAVALADVANVVIVADAPYNRIAFAGLWDRQRNRYVVEDFRVSLAPTATAFVLASARVPSRPNPVVRQASLVSAPANPVDASDNGVMARSLGSIYAEGRVVLNESATATRLIEEVAHRDVVHVAARVTANHELPSLSFVTLGDDPGERYSGTLFARHMGHAQPVRAQLVTLANGGGADSAPHTDDTFGFARALLAAGVTNVVSPVVELDARRVEQTWLDFHTHYASGTAVAESLRRAQLTALTAANRRPGPWATLAVFGSAH